MASANGRLAGKLSMPQDLETCPPNLLVFSNMQTSGLVPARFPKSVTKLEHAWGDGQSQAVYSTQFDHSYHFALIKTLHLGAWPGSSCRRPDRTYDIICFAVVEVGN